MLGRIKRRVLAMLADAARGSVPPALRAGLLTRPARGDLRTPSGRRNVDFSVKQRNWGFLVGELPDIVSKWCQTIDF